MSNKKNGLIQEKNSAGSVVKETEWVDGKKHGLERMYDASGAVVKEIRYEYGEKVVVDEFYQGKLSKHTPYLNGKKDGALIEYSRGKKVLEVNYSNGKKNGLSIRFNVKTGKPISEERYDFGEKDKNYYKQYDENGHIKSDRDGNVSHEYICDNNMPSFGYIYYDHYRIEAAVKYFKNGKIGIRQPYDGDRKFQYFDLEGNAITKSEFVKKYLSELNYPRGYIDAEVMAVDHYDLDGEDCDEDSEDFSDDIDSTVFTDEENSLFEHYNDALVRFLTIAEKLVSMKLITDTSIQNEFKEALGCFVEAKKKNEEYFK